MTVRGELVALAVGPDQVKAMLSVDGQPQVHVLPANARCTLHGAHSGFFAAMVWLHTSEPGAALCELTLDGEGRVTAVCFSESP